MIGLLRFREVIAEVLFVLGLGLVVILIHYLWITRHNYPKQWWKLRHVQGAMAFLALMFGDSLIRGWGTLSYVALRHGHSIFDLENEYPVALAGTIVTVFGMCWCIRLFSPYVWQERSWIFSMIAAVMFVLVMQVI